MRNINYLLIIASLLTLNACQSESTTTETNESVSPKAAQLITVSDEQFKVAQMTLGTLQDYAFNQTVSATGKIEVPVTNQVKVSVYEGGYVGNINLIPGQAVRKGQRLFTIENPAFIELQQTYLQTQAELRFLASDYERQKTLAAENITAEKNFLKIESEYQSHLALLEGLKKRLELLHIKPEELSPAKLVSKIPVFAPSNGYITSINARQGMYLSPTDLALELIDTEHLHLELFIFEKDILKIKKGQKVQFRLPEASKEIYDAEIYLIGKLLEEDRRVVQVHAHLSEAVEKSISIAGMYVEASVLMDQFASKSLPESAIVYEAEQAYVLVAVKKEGGNTYFKQVAVELGLNQTGQIQILNDQDFGPSDQILVKGAFNLIGIE